MFGTGTCLGRVLHNSWDRLAFGTGPSKFLGWARSRDRLCLMLLCLDMRFKMLGTGPLLGQFLVVPARIWLREQLCVRQWMNKGNILHLGVDVNKSL